MMRLTATGLATVLLLCGSAGAVELSYKWRKGDVHRFRYEDTSSFQVGMGGMGNIASKMKIRSVFRQKVLRVRPGGTADIELAVEKLDIFQGGRKLASLKKIPPAARRVKAEVDRKGRAKFYRMVSVYIHDDRVYVGVRKASVGPGGASASVSAGGPEGGVDVDLVASVDPKTGRITASARVRERPPALRKVTIKKEDPAVDVLPKDIFEMMVLPDGDLRPGATEQVRLPFVTMQVAMDELEGSVATLRVRSDAEVDTPAATGAQEEEEGDDMPGGGGMPGMEGMPGMKGMPGMEGVPGMPEMGSVPGMGAGVPGAGGTDGMQVHADVTTRFDVKAGKLLGMQGTIGTDVSMAGMGKVTTRSAFELERL